MKPDLQSIVRCPECYGRMALSVTESKDGVVFDGSLECISCGRCFPVVSGVALLAVIDRTWEPMLREFAARIEISEQVDQSGGFEKDREDSAGEYHEAVERNADELLEEALAYCGPLEGLRVLDVGAGLGELSARMADAGADVVSVDVEWSHLHFTLKNQVYQSYFSRVMGDVNRIPFKDCAFDVTCCRSTLHHLGDIKGSIKEMARVTRPGGHVLLISEPIRPFLDTEQEYLEGIFDFEQGLNEHTVPITEYTIPMALYCPTARVSYYRPSSRERTGRVLDRLHLDPTRLYRDHEQVGLIRSLKLLLTGAEVNVLGRRGILRAHKPRGFRPGEILGYGEDLVVSSERSKEHLQRLHRACLDPASLPESVRLFTATRETATRGWRSPEQVGDETYRYTTRLATCQLRNDRRKQNLSLRLLGYPSGAGAATGEVMVNGLPAGRYEIEGRNWVDFSFAKPANDEEILQVVIRNTSTFVADEVLHNGDVRELGVGVEVIWQE